MMPYRAGPPNEPARSPSEVAEAPGPLYGQLSGSSSQPTRRTWTFVPSLDATALLAAVPGPADARVTIRAHSFRSLPGSSLTLVDLADLVAEIHTNPSITDTRVVITQGTDTIEETAY